MEYKYPKYVRFKGSILRHIPNENTYWCDNGCWGICYWLDCSGPMGYRLMSKRDEHFPKSEVLYPATEYEWVQSVGEYVPSGYVLEDGTRWSKSKYIQGGYDEPDDEYDDFEIDEDGLPIRKNNEKYYLLLT